ncbi:unnamed protein product [Adineta ricciae]|uniref:Uncharacterized protein n=1 Tax=Adineta ricciae TaxID=249248 RepID=A0A814LX11_ADIRI|nr:unnamed protein product [Adineta ricciae]CAF1071319.1 unnamed protein product [Adineta ricciae]
MNDSRRVVYRSAPKERDPAYAPVYEPEYGQPTVIRSADIVSSEANVPGSSRRVVLVRRPNGVQNSTQVLSPERYQQVIHTRPRSRSPSPIQTYYTQSAPKVQRYQDVDDDVGCCGCCEESSSSRNYSYSSSDSYGNASVWNRILTYMKRHTCLIITIALIVLFIAVFCVIVCGVYLGLYPSSNAGLKIAGIVIGTLLAVGTVIFLLFMLCCLGQQDGFFSYFGKRPRIGGQAYALMPPPNSAQYAQPTGQVYAVSGQRPANIVYPTTVTNSYEAKPNKNNIVVELPEHLVSGRQTTPRTRERNLNKVVQNISHVVDDAKKRNHGEAPGTVLVKVT